MKGIKENIQTILAAIFFILFIFLVKIIVNAEEFTISSIFSWGNMKTVGIIAIVVTSAYFLFRSFGARKNKGNLSD